MNRLLIPFASGAHRPWLLPVAIAGIVASGIATLGWIGPDIDVWYGVGLVRALGERPLTPESLGHVPKLGHLLVLAPAVAFGQTPERYLALLGVTACGLLALAQGRWASRSQMAAPLNVAALLAIPLAWRATLDGGSVAWGWAFVLFGLREARVQRVALWLAVAALFRPEVVGVGLTLGALRFFRREKGWWLLVCAPLGGGVVGTALVDALWTGRFGASSVAHAIFESVTIEQIRGRWGFLDTAHPRSHFALPLVVLGVATVALEARRRAAGDEAEARHGALVELALAAAGFSIVTVANVATGGTLFVRFLLPWVSVVAASASMWPHPRAGWGRGVMGVAVLLAIVPEWRAVAPEFMGTYPSAPALLVARTLARQTAPELTVAMDAGVRAVSLGSGSRPWKTTPWIMESPQTACSSQVVMARGAFLRRIGPTIERCGPWQPLIMDTVQTRVDLQVLLARRKK